MFPQSPDGSKWPGQVTRAVGEHGGDTLVSGIIRSGLLAMDTSRSEYTHIDR